MQIVRINGPTEANKSDELLMLCQNPVLFQTTVKSFGSTAVSEQITSFPHTLSLCSKKAESKVKRVKSYYCTRVCKTYRILQTYMYGVPKSFTPPDTRCAYGIEDRHNFHSSHFKHSLSHSHAHRLQQLEACTLGSMHRCTLRLFAHLGVKSPRRIMSTKGSPSLKENILSTPGSHKQSMPVQAALI